MIEVSGGSWCIRRCRKESLQEHRLVRIFDESVEVEDCDARLHHRVGWNDRECLFKIKSVPIPEPFHH